MATTTFDKNIALDQTAADRLAEILSKPAPPRPDIETDFWKENERKVEAWLSSCRKS